MAFLTINGMVVPVASCSLDKDVDVSADIVMASGRTRRTRITSKRVWSIKSQIIPLADAMTLHNMLLCVGQYWPWDNADVFSSKGLPSNGTGVLFSPTYQRTTADGAANPLAAHDGNTSLLMASSTFNMVGYDGSIEGEGVPPFSAINNGNISRYTYASPTQPAVDGTSGLAISAAAQNISGPEYNGGVIATVNASSGTTYTASIYLNGTGGGGSQTVFLTLKDGAGKTENVVVAVSQSTWSRGIVTLTTAGSVGSNTTLTLSVTNALPREAFYVVADCVQIEGGSYARPWTATSRGASLSLNYTLAPEDYRNAHAVTVSCWTKYVSGGTASDTPRPLFALMSSVFGNGMGLTTVPGVQGGLQLVTYRNNTNIVATQLMTQAMGTGGWQHVAVQFGEAYDGTPVPGRAALWLNGIKQLDAYGLNIINPATLDTLWWGSISSQVTWQEHIDTGLYMPFWAGAQSCAMLAQSPSPFYAPPELLCGGDFCDYGTVLCVGSNSKVNVIEVPGHDGTQQRHGIVAFTLTET